MSNATQPDAQPHDQALVRLKLMFAKPEHPYYILAPSYRETSSGIVSLHYLCHLLNLNGREAYLCGTTEINPELKTPVLDAAVAERHRAAGKVPIAVYPEVISGNPLNLPVVARFLLNFEGFISGKPMDARVDDLLFYYAPRLAEHRGSTGGDLLCLPTIDIEMFCPSASDGPRQDCYLYQNRHPLASIDYSLLPADIKLLSIANALTLPELAAVLRTAQVLYTYEWSMTCVMAVLCGCPVIFMPGQGIDRTFLENSFFGCIGFAMLDEPDAVALARSSLDQALPRYVERTAPFWQQLDVFIDKTQLAARREAAGNRLGALDWLRQRYPQPAQLKVLNERLAKPAGPRLAVLVIDNGDSAALAETLHSLAHGLYQQAQVTVLGGAELPGASVRWLPCDPLQPVAQINDWLALSDCDWFMVVEAGVSFIASGLLMTAVHLLDTPAQCLAVYADEARRREEGAVELHLRPDLGLDLLLATPAAMSPHWWYRREAVVAQGGFDHAGGRAFELAYQLRLLVEQGPGCVGHVSEPLLIGQARLEGRCTDEQSVILAHLQARGYPAARVMPVDVGAGAYRIDYGHQTPASVSILIYLDGELQQFQQCLESLLAQTAHADYQVLLIEPGSAAPALLAWLEMIEQLDDRRVQVLRFMPGQPRAAMCNAAAQEATGEYLVWLDVHSRVLERGWLHALLNHAQRPEVGAVGGKLLDRDGKVRQAGLILGQAGTVGPAYAGWNATAPGWLGQLWLERNCPAVGGACLMLRRELFIEAGGFDADPLMAPWADVDLCLRLVRGGYLNVWTPYARLLLDDSPTPQPDPEQEDALYARWLPQLASDAGYNSNFSLRNGEGLTLENNGFSWRPLKGCVPSVLACAADQQQAGRSRVIQPFKALRDSGSLEGGLSAGLPTLVEIERLQPASVILQRPLGDAGLSALRRLRAFSQAFKVYDLDGYLPEMNISGGWDADELMQRLRLGMMHADRVLVASPALLELLRGEHDDVRLVESALPASWSDLRPLRAQGSKPRVGWIGSVDAHLLADVVPALANEVEWVVLGDCPAALQPLLTTWRPTVEPDHLAPALLGLDLDLALVPMAETLGNACSGDLRVLQHAACGHPVICSRVPGFAGGDVLPLTRVANTAADWIQAIRLHLADRQASACLGDALQGRVREGWLLEGERLQAWRRAWLAD
ncbi:glycosyltransferase [Pseudomonas sp. S37]|uniref:glycosyltransferase n=1 Tax=Pseudomonas sp. S37 TaxID=2767449 RepID=UPI001912594C|nr:glycosyltransferase [Pseudomonas sp. S37]MBK4994434.1 glycosyltransferase [Pseudomonas sp. S37]